MQIAAHERPFVYASLVEFPDSATASALRAPRGPTLTNCVFSPPPPTWLRTYASNEASVSPGTSVFCVTNATRAPVWSIAGGVSKVTPPPRVSVAVTLTMCVVSSPSDLT